MTFVTADRVRETSTSVGLGAFTLAGAAVGFQAYGDVMVDGDRGWYCIDGRASGQWEVGIGTWNTGNVLSRTTILASSNGGAAVSFSAGTKDVFMSPPANGIGREAAYYFLPQLKREDFIISEATLRALFSAPAILLPAVAGVFHQPVFGHWFREAGSAYTIGAATNLQLVLNAVVYDSQPVTGLLNGAGPYGRLMLPDMINGGGSPYGAAGIASPTRDDTNQALSLRLQGADLTGGSGRVFLSLFYRDWTLQTIDNFNGTTI